MTYDSPMRSAKDVVTESIAKWVRAEWRGDVTELTDLLDDDFVAVLPDGHILDKRQWIRRYSSGDLVNDLLRWDTTRLSHRGHVAFVIGALQQRSSFRGADASGSQTVSVTLYMGRAAPHLVGLHLASHHSPASTEGHGTTGQPRLGPLPQPTHPPTTTRVRSIRYALASAYRARAGVVLHETVSARSRQRQRKGTTP